VSVEILIFIGMKRLVLLFLLCLIGFSSFAQDDGKTSEDILVNYYNNGFEPYRNGVWYLAMTMSLRDQDIENTRLGLFDDVVIGNNSSWNLDLTTGRYISDYFLVGMTIGYEQSKFDGTLVGNFGTTFERVSDSELFTIGTFIRTSIPLTANNRLSFYNDLGFGFSFGNSQIDEIRNNNTETSTADIYRLGVGINPGITYFAVNNFAFEAGVNLIGYSYSREEGEDHNGVRSLKESHDVSFSVNLLTINLGVSYFFKTKTN